jgi:hypothetical protein
MGDFACPECGSGISVSTRVPGRQVQCPECETVVEVPYLPRVAAKGPPPWTLVPPVIWAIAGTLVVISLGLIVVKRTWRAQARQVQQQAMAALEAQVEQASQADQADETIAALEAALAREDLPWTDDQKAVMRKRRDDLAVRRAEAEIQRLSKLPEDLAIRDGMAFLGKIGHDPTLTEHIEGTRRLIARAATARFNRMLDEGTAALEAGQVVEAVTTCERLMVESQALPEWAAGTFPEKDRALGRRIAERYGARIEPITGTFWLGSGEAYEKALRPTLVTVLRERGYAGEPADPSLQAIWAALAPYRLTLTVTEKPAGTYLQSANQIARLDGQFVLKRPGLADWKQTAQAITEVPLPNLRAYQASRIAVGSAPSTDFQEKLFENAFQGLVFKLDRVSRMMPQRPG